MTEHKKSQANRKMLLDAGLRIIIQQGYNNTGIKQLVSAVGVPKGSFYNYFDSKEDFGIEIIDHYANQIQTRLDSALKTDANGLAALKHFFTELIQSFEDKSYREGCLVGNLAAEMADSSEPIRKALSTVYAQWQLPTSELLRRGQESKDVRHDIDAESLATFVWNTFEGALLRMKVEKSIEPLNQWYRYMLEDFVLFSAENNHS